MKQLLIHHARPVTKRVAKTELPDLPGPHSTEHSLIEVDDVLNRLAAINPALRRVVELRVFEGLTREEIARKMGCGTATVARQWNFARNWLERLWPEPRSHDARMRSTRPPRRHWWSLLVLHDELYLS
jgi:RNA polymerase sigma factor (sigma-70 family)